MAYIEDGPKGRYTFGESEQSQKEDHNIKLDATDNGTLKSEGEVGETKHGLGSQFPPCCEDRNRYDSYDRDSGNCGGGPLEDQNFRHAASSNPTRGIGAVIAPCRCLVWQECGDRSWPAKLSAQMDSAVDVSGQMGIGQDRTRVGETRSRGNCYEYVPGKAL